MNINWKVRVKNPYFWMLCEQIKEVASNPFAIGCLVIAALGYVNDPTTKGLSDSENAMTYERPKE